MTELKRETPQDGGLEYTDAVAAAREQIRRLLKEAPSILRRMASHLAKASGKMIRARALLACAMRHDGLISADAVKAAAAVELLHLATLVHDDIIDNADKRRGIDALHKKFGEKYAILCGDWLFCTALECVSTISALNPAEEGSYRTFPRYLSDVCLGEVRQDQNNFNFRLSEREYFKIIRGKTAALFEASFYAGFVLCGEDASTRDVYLEIGSNIGLIFQLADDCADYESTQKLAKKPVLSDFSRGVVTLPLIYALKNDKTLLAKIEAGIEPAALKAAVAEAGGLEYAHAKINRLYKKTRAAIEFLDTNPEKKQLLTRLLCQAAGVINP